MLLHLIGNSYFEDAVAAVQSEVDYLTSLEVNKIIILAHSWGYLEEVEAYEITKSVPGVDILVMGGLNLLQYAGQFFIYPGRSMRAHIISSRQIHRQFQVHSNWISVDSSTPHTSDLGPRSQAQLTL